MSAAFQIDSSLRTLQIEGDQEDREFVRLLKLQEKRFDKDMDTALVFRSEQF